jgi:hypothetical protein
MTSFQTHGDQGFEKGVYMKCRVVRYRNNLFIGDFIGSDYQELAI